jgi:hypothetical protein
MKISKQRFVREFTKIGERALADLPAEEQDRRISNFEKSVAEICRDNHSKALRAP